PQRARFTGRFGSHTIDYRGTRHGLQVEGIDGVDVVSATPAEVVLDIDGVRRRFAVTRYATGTAVDVYVDSVTGSVPLRAEPRFADPADAIAAGSLLAPMPGSVVRIAVAAGDTVDAGQPILWLEAMKMQHQINAPVDGTVAELPVREGQQVDVGAVLAVVTPTEETA